MEKINVQNFKKYYRNNDENAIVARVGHVNAVIEALNAGGGGSGLEGTNYVFVSGNGTDVENAAELQTAYDLAIIKASPIVTPINMVVSSVFDTGGGTYQISLSNFSDVNYFTSGQFYDVVINGTQYSMFVNGIMSNILFVNNLVPGLSFTSFTFLQTTNPIVTVVVAPGYYNFENTAFTIFVENINVVSLTGNRDVFITGGGQNLGYDFSNIMVYADNILVKGLVTDIVFFVENDLGNTIIENCKGGDYSFGYSNFNLNSTFINCEAANYSFAFLGTASGTFINCKAVERSFGTSSSGTFIDCEAGVNSFGYFGSAYGLFKNCTAEENSFGAFSIASGSFYNCIAGDYGFGYQGTASGTFNDCKALDLSFGYNGTASGIFTNCTGDDSSFGGGSGVLTGRLYYCKLNSSTFQTVSGAGITRLCIDGNNVENNQG